MSEYLESPTVFKWSQREGSDKPNRGGSKREHDEVSQLQHVNRAKRSYSIADCMGSDQKDHGDQDKYSSAPPQTPLQSDHCGTLQEQSF